MVTWLRLNADLIYDPGWLRLPDDHARTAYVEALCRAKLQDSPYWQDDDHFRMALGPYGDALEALLAANLLQRHPGGSVSMQLEDWEASQRSDPKGNARQRNWVNRLKEKAAQAGQAEGVTNGTTERNETGPNETPRNATKQNQQERDATRQSAVQTGASQNFFEEGIEGAKKSGAKLPVGPEDSLDDDRGPDVF